ncbi:MAG TPA: glycosyltransferase [Patescibacteria group bacterium]|nr:glycosyltransferase [Patescibacteria group bacterium]
MASPAKHYTVFILASTLVLGGAEKVVRALALGLPDHGFTPHILCLRGPGGIGQELSARGVRVHFGLMRSRHDPGAFFRLYRLFRGERGSILYALDHHDALFWGGLASRAAGVRWRVTPVHSTGLWGKEGSFTRTDRLVLPMYDRVVALSAAHADYITRQGGIEPSRVAVINNGVDAGRFKPVGSRRERDLVRESLDLAPYDFVVAIVAALRPEKNHEMFLRAAAEFRSRGGRGVFLVVGDGKEAGELHGLARELALGNAVRFMGARDDIPAILAASDVSVLCSHPIVETFPLSVLEAMACGIPVVVTAVGSIPEMITDGREGLMIPPGDVGALAEALLDLGRDTVLRDGMGKRARERVVSEFSEARMVAEYAALFRTLQGGGAKGVA